jgi:4-hydroxy-4-methyl-2-oxoglutarate aldolase
LLKVNPMPTQVSKEKLDRLAQVDPATIGHFRHWGFSDPELRPLIPRRRVVGTAVTVALPSIDSIFMHHVMGMVRPGDFLVVDRLGDRRHACMGGVVALAAKVAGVVGIAIDGYACDFDEIRQHDLPLWCRGETALTAKFLAAGGAINIPVVCAGAAVLPGDAVLADTGGICFLRPDEVDEACDIALPMQNREPSRIERLRAGEKLGAVNGSSARVEKALDAQREKYGP